MVKIMKVLVRIQMASSAWSSRASILVTFGPVAVVEVVVVGVVRFNSLPPLLLLNNKPSVDEPIDWFSMFDLHFESHF